MLTVAIHRYQHLDVLLPGIGKGRDQGSTVTAIDGMREDFQARQTCQNVGGAISGAVVDDQNARAVTTDLLNDALNVRRFVVDRNGREKLHDRGVPWEGAMGPCTFFILRRSSLAGAADWQQRLPLLVEQSGESCICGCQNGGAHPRSTPRRLPGGVPWL